MAGQSAVEDIRETLRREIVERMEVGDLLPNERELAERFGVARNTVRETMIHLEAFGLIEKTRRAPASASPTSTRSSRSSPSISIIPARRWATC